jgi:predicted amidophosphoribosyltransferase
LIEAALPAACPHCDGSLGGFDIGLCAACSTSLRPEFGNRCPRCGVPGPSSVDDCLACEADPPPQTATVTWSAYEGPVRSAVLALKHGAHDEMARLLGPKLAALVAAEEWWERIDAVTFVPSHAVRRIRRGPSAAHEIARVVALSLERPYRPLLRRRGLGRQAGRSRADRLRLGATAFRAIRRPPEGILLVDDVVTTGTTLRHAARALLSAGAHDVFCAVVARTPDPRRPT